MGNDSIRIQATSGMTTTKQVEREIPLQNKQKRLGLNLRRQQNGFIVKGSKSSIVQLLKGLEDKFMRGIVNPNSLPYTIHKEEVELDENKYTYTVVHAKKGKEIVKANSSYQAAKKYAQMKGLKSTAGVDAHLMKLDDKIKSLMRRPEETIKEFTKKDFDKNEDENKHTENGVAIVNKFGTSAEKMQMAGIASRHKMNNSISIQDQQARDKMINKYYKRLESKNEELDTDDKSVVKKVADKLAKASKAHAGQSKELKKAMTEKSNFTSAQIKQAYGIANDPRYKQGNMSGAAVFTVESDIDDNPTLPITSTDIGG